MNFRHLILKNIKYNIRNYMGYFLGNGIMLSILFMFYNFEYSQSFIERSKKVFNVGEKLMLEIIVMLVVIIFILYLTTSFINTRGKETGIYYTIGFTKKEIFRILLYQNIVLVIVSAFASEVIGIVFSKLFNMAFLKIMGMSDINIGINIYGFLSVTAASVLIIILSSVYQKILLNIKSVIGLIKYSDKQKVSGRYGFIRGIVSAAVFIISLNRLLAIFNKEEMKIIDCVFVGIAVVSLFFLIGSMLEIVSEILKKFKKIYNSNILVINELRHKFSLYRVTIFVSVVMTCCGLFFIIDGFSTYKLAGNWIDRDYKSDISIIADKNQKDNNDFKNLIEQCAGEIDNYEEIESLEEHYFEKDTDQGGYKMGSLRMISDKTYNAITKSQINLNDKEVIVPSNAVVCNNGRRPIRGDLVLKLDGGEGKAVSDKTVYGFTSNLSRYMKSNNDYKYITFEGQNIKYQKMNLTNGIYDCETDMRPAFVVISSSLYDSIKKDYDQSKIYYDILADFRGTCDSETVYENLNQKLSSIGGDKLSDTLQIKMHEKKLERTKGAFVVFLFMFLGIMFLSASIIALYYKVFISLDSDRYKKVSLTRIGLINKEIKNIFLKQIRIIFVTPYVFSIGILSILLYKWYTILDERNVAFHTESYVFLVYTAVFVIIYECIKLRYIKKVMKG